MTAKRWAVAIGMLLAVGCGKAGTPSPSGKGSDEAPPFVSKLGTPDFNLSAADFHAEHKKGNLALAQKYAGKVIEVQGVVKNVGRNVSKMPYIALEAEDLLGVMCFTMDKKPWERVAVGQKVKVRGKFPEAVIGVTLSDCEVAEAGEGAAATLPATDLARKYRADPDAVSKKYDKKSLIVFGEVVKKDYDEGGAPSLELKGADQVKVLCAFTAFEKDLVDPIQVGQHVHIIGQYMLNFGKDEVGLYFCFPLTKK